jgi:hypothetical protein
MRRSNMVIARLEEPSSKLMQFITSHTTISAVGVEDLNGSWSTECKTVISA